MVDNPHDQSLFLVRHENRHLRFASMWLMAAFVAGTAGIALKQLAG
jgi:hypothetical protein